MRGVHCSCTSCLFVKVEDHEYLKKVLHTYIGGKFPEVLNWSKSDQIIVVSKIGSVRSLSIDILY